MGSAPSPPPTPDPYKTASAQQMANVEVAVANSFIANADEDSPQGSIRYTDSGKTQNTYTYDGSGNITGTRVVPKPKRSITLTTKGQAAWDKTEDIKLVINTWGLAHVGYLQSLPRISADGLIARPLAPGAPSITTDAIVPGALISSIGSSDTAAHLVLTRTAIESRLNYQREIERDLLRSALAHQGLVAGMVAYDRAMLAFDKQATDGQLQAYLAAGQEQTRIIQTEGMVSDFANRVTQLRFAMATSAAEWLNQTQQLRFKALAEAAEYVNNLRERQLQELVAIMGGNINILSALQGGGQVQTPNFQPFKAGTIDKTPVAESVYQSAAMDMQKWQVKVQQQQQMMGGIMGFAGNLAGGMLAMSDRRLKTNIRHLFTTARGIRVCAWRYIWDDPKEVRIGVIAQELREVMPQAVAMLPCGYLAVNYAVVGHG